MTSKELYEKLVPSEEKTYKYAYLSDHGLEINLESMFSGFIKDAARCNSYNSDVYYDIHHIKETLREFNPESEFEPIWIGFRKMGVDGTSYVLCNAENDYPRVNLSSNYFALYSVNIVHEEDNYYNIVLCKYAV